ncbi:MAG: hypothetical protein QXM37_00510 [Candidatus Bathyarchaeia archaeon]
MESPTTEIRTFYSIREIRELVEAEISQHKTLLDDYSQWLGTLLRSAEYSKNPEWGKKVSEFQKILRSGSRKGGKKEEKPTFSSEWVEFKDLMICVDEFGEVEIIFEAVEALKDKLERLEKAKNSLTELERYGFGKNVVFVTYIHEGVPEKIAVKPKKTLEGEEKFRFVADFSVVKQI